MYEKYWNKLPPSVMVFDARTPRSATVFGRGSDSAKTLYQERQDYIDLVDNPNLVRIHAAGYDYIYYTSFYYADHHDLLENACAKKVEQIDDIHSETGQMGDFRRLVDITGCK